MCVRERNKKRPLSLPQSLPGLMRKKQQERCVELIPSFRESAPGAGAPLPRFGLVLKSLHCRDAFLHPCVHGRGGSAKKEFLFLAFAFS